MQCGVDGRVLSTGEARERDTSFLDPAGLRSLVKSGPLSI